MKIRTIVFSALLLILATIPRTVAAHSGMYTAKFVDGGNIVLLTYNVDHLESGYPIIYNFRLFDTTGVPIPFEQAHVSFKSDNKTSYDQTLPASEDGDISLTHTFPKNDTYTMYIQFLDHNKEISKAEFPIAVEQGPRQSLLYDIASWQSGVFFILGGAATYAVLNKTRLITKARTYLSSVQKHKHKHSN